MKIIFKNIEKIVEKFTKLHAIFSLETTYQILCGFSNSRCYSKSAFCGKLSVHSVCSGFFYRHFKITEYHENGKIFVAYSGEKSLLLFKKVDESRHEA